MEKEKPYQPSEEEIKKAEESMTEKQKALSFARETNLSEDEMNTRLRWDEGYEDNMRMLENGDVEITEGWTPHDDGEKRILLPQEALKKIENLKKAIDLYIKKVETRLEYAKIEKDKILLWEQKILKSKKEKEEK